MLGGVNHRIQPGWLKWRSASNVLCDEKVALKLKEFFYVNHRIQPMMMIYETKCWGVKNQHENKLSVVEMRILCWMCGETS